jgi:hypothetical protein
VTIGVRSEIGLIDCCIEDCIVWLYRHTTTMEQILACLLAEINAVEEKMEAKTGLK